MIITIKESKLEKVNPNFFTICAISKKKFDDNYTDFNVFMPTADLLTGKEDGSLSKKSFKKKYTKQLKKCYTEAEYLLYNIGLAIKENTSFCFTCSDEEYELGYVQILAKFISKYYGVEYGDSKEVLSAIKDEIKSYEKKERKLLDEDPEELSGKKKKARKHIIKDIKASFSSEMSHDGDDALDRLATRYAIDVMANNLMRTDEPVFQINNECEITDFAPENCNVKSKDLVEQFLLPKDDEAIGDVVKKIVKELGCKYKYDDIKELGKEKILLLIAKVYIALLKYKMGDYDNAD